MDHIGFNLGKVKAPASTALSKLLGSRPPAYIMNAAATESEWVARNLEGLGHKVVVTDPNFAPMYATRSRRAKTDKRDARTLAEARLPHGHRQL